MPNVIKIAFDRGCQQAALDFGLVKLAKGGGGKAGKSEAEDKPAPKATAASTPKENAKTNLDSFRKSESSRAQAPAPASTAGSFGGFLSQINPVSRAQKVLAAPASPAPTTGQAPSSAGFGGLLNSINPVSRANKMMAAAPKPAPQAAPNNLAAGDYSQVSGALGQIQNAWNTARGKSPAATAAKAPAQWSGEVPAPTPTPMQHMPDAQWSGEVPAPTPTPMQHMPGPPAKRRVARRAGPVGAPPSVSLRHNLENRKVDV